MVQRTEIQEKNLQRVERDGPCDMFFFHPAGKILK